MSRIPVAVALIHARKAVPCAFCKGKGTDPFNVMSERSACGACDGTGTRVVPEPGVVCVYCGGSGSYKTYRCPVCDGGGVVAAPSGPTRTCSDCRGRGADGSSGLPCLACRGHGTVPA